MNFHNTLFLFVFYVTATGSYCFTLFLGGEVTYHRSWICSALSFPLKLSTAACAKAHILLERGGTDTFIYSFALQKKLSSKVFSYHAGVSGFGFRRRKPGQNQ